MHDLHLSLHPSISSHPPPSWTPLRNRRSRRGRRRWLSLRAFLPSRLPSLLPPFLPIFSKDKRFPGLKEEIGREECPRRIHPHDEEPKEERIGTEVAMPSLLCEERMEDKPDQAVHLGKEGGREGGMIRRGDGSSNSGLHRRGE